MWYSEQAGRYPSCTSVHSRNRGLGESQQKLPVCRNWQTRQTQNLLSARVCGFESHHRHPDVGRPRMLDFQAFSGFFLCLPGVLFYACRVYFGVIRPVAGTGGIIFQGILTAGADCDGQRKILLTFLTTYPIVKKRICVRNRQNTRRLPGVTGQRMQRETHRQRGRMPHYESDEAIPSQLHGESAGKTFFRIGLDEGIGPR